MKTQMMKKRNTNPPLITSRRFFHFLITFLLTSSMCYATCNPQDAYTTTDQAEEKQPPSGKMYISEGATLFIAEDTTISGAEIIHTDVADVKKTEAKLSKKDVEKPKISKKIATTSQPIASAPPVEIISSNAPGQIWSTNGSSSKQLSITSNTSIKYFAAVMDSRYITAILLFITLLMAVYQGPILNRSFFGRNFQRPPPMSF